jgi:hypothetical protein
MHDTKYDDDDLEISTEGRDLSDALHLPTENRVFYHGTSKRNARRILREGLRDWSWTESTPKIKYKAGEGATRWLHDGMYGRGTYVSCNWRVALYFGPVMFRVELQPATRLLRLDVPPDRKTLDSLKRNFGNEILAKNPLKVMPRNKRLTLNEAVQLARHHVDVKMHAGWDDRKSDLHDQRMRELRSILVRYGIHGWGEAKDLNGIVVFATDRISVREVVVSVPSPEMSDAFHDPTRRHGSHASLQAMITTMHRATNRGAANTRRWFAEANQALRAGDAG